MRSLLLLCASTVLVAWRAQTRPEAPTVRSPADTASVDLLGLATNASTGDLPRPWRARAVRGQRAPDARVVDSAGTSFLRIEGTGRAGWYVRTVDPQIRASGGRLTWSWRVPMAPAGTDLRSAKTDDAALRVFVSFGPLRTFGRAPRSIFYSFGGPEPAGYERPGHGSADVFVVRVGAAVDARDWQAARVDPFADYVRAWGDDPPPIAVVGLLQDTDQTRQRAVADLRSLRWRRADALDP